MSEYSIVEEKDDFYDTVYVIKREPTKNLFEENSDGIIGKYLSMEEAERIKGILENTKF